MLQVDETSRSIHAEGEVGYMDEGFTRNQFLEAVQILEDGTQPMTIHLQSPGGDVFSGQSMFNILNRVRGRTTVVVDSLSASIATVIMLGADEVLANKNASFMIHNPFTLVIGDAKEFRHTADVLDKLARDAAEIYSEKNGWSVDQWLEVMDAGESWYSADEALEIGLIDGVLERGGRKPKERSTVTAVQSVTAKPKPGLARAQVMANYRRKELDRIQGRR